MRGAERRPRVTLRTARDDDAHRLLNWRNDPDAVRFSVTRRAVTTEEHAEWFAAQRNDPATRIWIAEEAGVAVGQVRLDVRDHIGTVSVTVAVERRGEGLGPDMLQALVAMIAGDSTVRTLKALAHPDNAASFRAFQKVGFRRLARDERGFAVLELSLAG